MNMRGDRKEHHFLVNVLLLTIILFLLTAFVFGYNSNLEPIVMGHSANEVSGTIVGGGGEKLTTYSCADIEVWGDANCIEEPSFGKYQLICPSGSTKQRTGWDTGFYMSRFICVTD